MDADRPYEWKRSTKAPGMTSGHRLIAIIGVWLALASAFVVLFSENGPPNTIIPSSIVLALAGVLATMFITRSDRRSE